MSKKFPCPYCKGEGEWVEPVLDDGSGPTYHCGFCNGEGMIEIGSDKHMQIKAENPPKWAMWEMLAERGEALAEVIDALKKLPADGWSDGPYLLEKCQRAMSFAYDPRKDMNTR